MSKVVDRVTEKLIGLDPIRTLGLYQPFATLMMPPYNKDETRWVKSGRKPPFPLGIYMIYSTKKQYASSEVKHIAGPEYFPTIRKHIAEECETKGAGVRWRNADGTIEFNNGVALCVGELMTVEPWTPMKSTKTFVFVDPSRVELVPTDCDEVEDTEPATQGVAINGYTLWNLCFRDMKRIEPFQFKGKQGVGILSMRDREKIKILP